MRRGIRYILLLALIVGVAVLLSGYGASEESSTKCTTAPTPPSLELVYQLEAGAKRVTQPTRHAAMRIVCKRLQTILKAGAQVRGLAGGRMRVVLPSVGGSRYVQRVAEQISEPGWLYFFDWEPNLIGPERRVGGHSGMEPPTASLRRADREWRAAGRNVSDPANAQLISAGAFPNAYDAVKLASEQKPRKRCAACSSLTPRFYGFDRSPTHGLIAGPFSNRSALHRAMGQSRSHNAIVLRVPIGTTIVSEPAFNRSGEAIAGAEPGWFALKDRPVLNGSEIVRPNQEVDDFGRPDVTFGFTKKGRVAFERLTRKIAKRGRKAAIGPVSSQNAEALSGHFATIFDGEVKTRPIINFAEFPDGVDARVGAQLSGAFPNLLAAQNFVKILKIGGLPIDMTLIRQQVLQYPERGH